VGGLFTEGRTPSYDLGEWSLNDELAAACQCTVATWEWVCIQWGRRSGAIVWSVSGCLAIDFLV